MNDLRLYEITGRRPAVLQGRRRWNPRNTWVVVAESEVAARTIALQDVAGLEILSITSHPADRLTCVR